MKKINYHTHTYRCGHAVGTEKEMIESAISLGIEELGMSEHIPLPYYTLHLLSSIPYHRSLRSIKAMIIAFKKNGPNMRLKYKDMNKHLSLLEKYKEEYKDKIKIYKGFEAEGYKVYFKYYKRLLDDNKVDYLILGHHFHKYSIHDDYIGKKNCTKKDLYIYAKDIEEALDTKLFTYLAHPDLFFLGYKHFDEDAKKVSRIICEAAKRNNIPLEINAGGIRKGYVKVDNEDVYLYPNYHFWKIASEIGNDVIIGFDAHHPDDFNDEMYNQLLEFSKENKLNIIDKLQFLKGKKSNKN